MDDLRKLVIQLRKIQEEQETLEKKKFQIEQEIRSILTKHQDLFETAARDENISQLVERLV